MAEDLYPVDRGSQTVVLEFDTQRLDKSLV